MKPEQAAEEILELLDELEHLRGRKPSKELVAFLSSMSSVNTPETISKHPKQNRKAVAPKKRRPRKRKDPAAVAKTIQHLSIRLRENFSSDTQFEQSVQALAESGLTKANVIKVYNELFDTNKDFPKSVTKIALLKALRKDRIARIRAAS